MYSTRLCCEPLCLHLVQVEWLQPYTDAKIRELGAAGTRALLAVPISFVSEHIETLEEIDQVQYLAVLSSITFVAAIEDLYDCFGVCQGFIAGRRHSVCWHPCWASCKRRASKCYTNVCQAFDALLTA